MDTNTNKESVDHALLKIIIVMAGFAWITVFGLVGYIGIKISGSVDKLSDQLIEFKIDVSQRLTKVESKVEVLNAKEHP